MIPLLVSALMWLLVGSLLILRRGREERTITYAALTIAIAQTLSIDAVYEALDRLVGGTNILNLVADLALMIGVFFLGRGVAKASNPQPWAVQLALGRSALATALVCVIVAFCLIDRGGTTTTFMLDLGDQPAAAAYSTIQFLYYGSVLTAMAVLAARQIQASRGIQSLPPASLLIGSIFGVMLAATVITMNLAHVADNLELMTAVSVAYGPLYLLTFFFLWLASPQSVHGMRDRANGRLGCSSVSSSQSGQKRRGYGQVSARTRMLRSTTTSRRHDSIARSSRSATR